MGRRGACPGDVTRRERRRGRVCRLTTTATTPEVPWPVGVPGGEPPLASLVRKSCRWWSARASPDVSVPPTATRAEVPQVKVCQVKSRRRAAGAAAARCSGRERGAERIRAAELVSVEDEGFLASLFCPVCVFVCGFSFVFFCVLRFCCHVPPSMFF